MRHQNSGRKLNRTSAHRKAMFSNLCCALIENEQIKTTLPKAKDLRGYIERLITVSKKDSVAARRYVFDRLRSKAAVGKLFTILGPRFVERPGGYVRVLKCDFRAGDNAPMAIIELVERTVIDEDLELEMKAEKSKKTKPDTKPKQLKAPEKDEHEKKSVKAEKLEKTDKTDKEQKASKAEKVAKAEKVTKVEKTEKVAKKETAKKSENLKDKKADKSVKSTIADKKEKKEK